MKRRFLLLFIFQLLAVVAFSTKYEIVKLSTPTIKIGSKECKKGSIFESGEVIHWTSKKQGMWVRDLSKSRYNYFLCWYT